MQYSFELKWYPRYTWIRSGFPVKAVYTVGLGQDKAFSAREPTAEAEQSEY